MAASVWRVRDELWEKVRPLLPEHRLDPRGGRPRVDDRVCFNAIMFVLVTVSLGGICRRRWVVHRRRRIAGLRPGSERECGSVCTKSSCVP